MTNKELAEKVEKLEKELAELKKKLPPEQHFHFYPPVPVVTPVIVPQPYPAPIWPYIPPAPPSPTIWPQVTHTIPQFSLVDATNGVN